MIGPFFLRPVDGKEEHVLILSVLQRDWALVSLPGRRGSCAHFTAINQNIFLSGAQYGRVLPL